MPVAVPHVDHPLIADSLVRVRDANTPNAIFRQEIERIGSLLLAEATRNLPTQTVRVTTPLTETSGRVLAAQPVVVPVLRAGLGFLHAAQELLPNADIGFIGVSRDEATFQPKSYVNKLPESLAGRQCIVLDPMLATGGSLAHACQQLIERGATGTIIVVCVLAAPEGIQVLEQAGLDLAIYTAAVDERLNEHAFIVPGHHGPRSPGPAPGAAGAPNWGPRPCPAGPGREGPARARPSRVQRVAPSAVGFIRPASRRTLASPASTSKMHRCATFTVQSAWSYAGATSIRSKPTSGVSRASRRSARSRSAEVSPPGSGVPVPGANAGSRQSMSTLT